MNTTLNGQIWTVIGHKTPFIVREKLGVAINLADGTKIPLEILQLLEIKLVAKNMSEYIVNGGVI